MSKASLIVGILGAIVGTCIGWYTYVAYAPLSEDELTTIHGILKSAEEKHSRTQAYLEFYIVERSIRFRVPLGDYDACFQKAAFFENVRSGTSISFQVKTAELEDPLKPTDGVETVFVYSLRDRHNTYYSLEDYRKRKDRNKDWALVVGIVFPIIGALLIYWWLQDRGRGEGEVRDER